MKCSSCYCHKPTFIQTDNSKTYVPISDASMKLLEEMREKRKKRLDEDDKGQDYELD
jgi:hypothetical protein